MVSVTETAAGKIKELMDRDGRPEAHGLRLKVIGGGCSGFQYQLDFDETTRTDDSVIEAYGIRVFVDMKSALFLTGTELDYDDGLMGTGFRFNNPNAKNQCGCGESFSV
jgi:iron-sulfur cluster assembly protein